MAARVKYYIDDVAAFSGSETPWAGAVVRPSLVTGRALELVVPAGSGTFFQWLSLRWAENCGVRSGVDVKIIPM